MSENSRDNKIEAQQDVVMTPICPNGQLYTVKSGDTMFFIARRFNISLQSLINANPQITDPNTIYPGQVICIPSAAPGPGVPCPGGRIYRVVSGDTMFEIARRFGVTLDELIRANPQIMNPDLIFPGQEICAPLPAPGPIPCPSGTLYVVKPGDTMYEIAKMNNISLTALIVANPQISDPNMIFPGQVICIPKPAMEIPVMPMPEMPMPLPMPMPAPPTMIPLPPVTSPIMMPPVMPCPPGPMIQPMPVYVVIPWEECPYRPKKRKKREHHRKYCR
jgi:spore coat assembly protein SafA